jgi:hypothetical protein
VEGSPRRSNRSPFIPAIGHEKAEWAWGVLDELEKQGLVTLADKGYQDSTWA